MVIDYKYQMKDNHPLPESPGELMFVSWLEAEMRLPNKVAIKVLAPAPARPPWAEEILVEASMTRIDVIDHIREYGAQLSPPQLAAMGYELAIETPIGFVFLETIPYHDH